MAGDDTGGTDDDVLTRNLVRLLDGLDRQGLPRSHVLRRLEQALSAAERVLGVDRVGLMLLDQNDDLQVVGASDPVSEDLERAQLHLRVGPTWDSLHDNRAVAVADLAHGDYDALWQWLRQASADGAAAVPVRAVLSVAVRSGGEAFGTLNVMRAQAGRWTEQQLRAVQAYADVIGTLLTLGVAAAPPHATLLEPGHDG